MSPPLLPQYQHTVFAYGQPAFFGEVALMLWLVVMGASPPNAARSSPPAGATPQKPQGA